jgi:hypothetical protein
VKVSCRRREAWACHADESVAVKLGCRVGHRHRPSSAGTTQRSRGVWHGGVWSVRLATGSNTLAAETAARARRKRGGGHGAVSYRGVEKRAKTGTETPDVWDIAVSPHHTPTTLAGAQPAVILLTFHRAPTTLRCAGAGTRLRTPCRRGGQFFALDKHGGGNQSIPHEPAVGDARTFDPADRKYRIQRNFGVADCGASRGPAS